MPSTKDDVAEIAFDFDDLTLGEAEDLEEALGVPISEVTTNVPQARMMRAIAWIVMRRSDPEMPFEATRDLKVSDASTLLGLQSDPT